MPETRKLTIENVNGLCAVLDEDRNNTSEQPLEVEPEDTICWESKIDGPATLKFKRGVVLFGTNRVDVAPGTEECRDVLPNAQEGEHVYEDLLCAGEFPIQGAPPKIKVRRPTG